VSEIKPAEGRKSGNYGDYGDSLLCGEYPLSRLKK
jgi:hypothetical protein